MRRVIFLNRFYWPEENATSQLLTDLAEALAAAGHDVTVITSRPGWSALQDRTTHRGVRVQRVTGTRWAKHGLPFKAVDFVTFHASALLRLVFTAQRGDAVVALTDPPLLGVGAWLAARLCGARIFHWVQDVYPEIAARLTGQHWLEALGPLRNLAWRRSNGCVTLGSDMAATLAGAGVPAEKIKVIPNWAPAGLAVPPAAASDRLRHDWDLAGRFVVAYSGNLGRVHDLSPVLDVATVLRDDEAIAFVFVGSGAQRRQLESDARARGLTRVRFFPAQPRDRLTEVLRSRRRASGHAAPGLRGTGLSQQTLRRRRGRPAGDLHRAAGVRDGPARERARDRPGLRAHGYGRDRQRPPRPPRESRPPPPVGRCRGEVWPRSFRPRPRPGRVASTAGGRLLTPARHLPPPDYLSRLLRAT